MIPQVLNILRIIGGILSPAVSNIPEVQVFHHPNKRPQCIYMAVVEILISNLIWFKHLYEIILAWGNMGQKEDSLLFHNSSRFDCFTTDKSYRVMSTGEDLLPRDFPEGLPALTNSDVCVFNVGVGHTGVCTHQHLQTSTDALCQRVPGYTLRDTGKHGFYQGE